MAFKFDKKLLCHTGAGIAAVILVAVAVSQCNDKHTVQEAAGKALNEMDSTLTEAKQIILESREAIGSLREENAIQADSIVVLNDSINVLNDSLNVVNGRLADCQGRRVRQNSGVRPRPNPTPVKPQKDTVVVIQQVPTPQSGNNTNINIGSGANVGGDITVNNGGVINNYYGDTAQKKEKCKVLIIRRANVKYNVR